MSRELRSKVDRIEKELKGLKEELQKGRIVNEFNAWYLTARIDVPELEKTQNLILDHLGMEIKKVYAHTKLQKVEKNKEAQDG